jgi:two-component sensor histidine kinase/HAMP domain-containing protein
LHPIARFLNPSSLRFRLLFAFLVLVALILFVGVASFTINQQVRSQVAELRSSDVLDLRSVDLASVGIEVEGYWNPSGSFVATDVEVMPTVQRPRLRGAIQAVDAGARTITVYGMPVHVAEGTESGDDEKRDVDFASLASGQRVEVQCTVVEGGRWEARKIQQRDVKASDKIKGTATASELDGLAPETVEIHGLLIVVQPATAGGPESALGRIEKANQMILALQECRAAAHDLVHGTRAPERNGADDQASEPEALAPAAERLTQAAQEFGRIVQQSHSEGDDPRVTASPSYLRPLRALAKEQPALDEHVALLGELARSDSSPAAEELDEVFDPFLEEELMPLVYAYLSQAEEDLGDQLRRVLARTATTTRVALATSVVAVIVAIVLGFLVWRSIHRPIRALHDAAVRLGQGHLDTRVQLESHDEIGVLAEAFNKMASDLATTTVSIESLERIQERLRESLSEKELLLREVHHRVKNNMQVISSLLAMQSTGGDPAVAKRLEESQNRIRSIALIHEQLYRSTELAHIDVRAYLEVLTSQLLQSFGRAGQVRLELETDPITLDIDQSMACGLIVNELVTNALKYAFPGDRSGTIRVALREHAGEERMLTVGDDGPGLGDVDPRGTKTLGMSLIATLARQLRGRVEFGGAKGTLVSVIFPRKSVEALAS